MSSADEQAADTVAEAYGELLEALNAYEAGNKTAIDLAKERGAAQVVIYGKDGWGALTSPHVDLSDWWLEADGNPMPDRSGLARYHREDPDGFYQDFGRSIDAKSVASLEQTVKGLFEDVDRALAKAALVAEEQEKE